MGGCKAEKFQSRNFPFGYYSKYTPHTHTHTQNKQTKKPQVGVYLGGWGLEQGAAHPTVLKPTHASLLTQKAGNGTDILAIKVIVTPGTTDLPKTSLTLGFLKSGMWRAGSLPSIQPHPDC